MRTTVDVLDDALAQIESRTDTYNIDDHSKVLLDVITIAREARKEALLSHMQRK